MEPSHLNRAGRRALEAQARRAARPRIDDLRERVEDDLTTITLHPTKGFRRVSGKRVQAQEVMPQIAIFWAKAAAASVARAAGA